MSAKSERRNGSGVVLSRRRFLQTSTAVLAALAVPELLVTPKVVEAKPNDRASIQRAESAFEVLMSDFFEPEQKVFIESAGYPAEKKPAYSWPFSRAMRAALLLTGIREIGKSYAGVAYETGTILEKYSDGSDGYYSAVVNERPGSDKYLDDNAWNGLDLLSLYQLIAEPQFLERAQRTFNFAISFRGDRFGCATGGLYWKEQKRGETNHDRTTVSNAGVAQLGMLLFKQTGHPSYMAWAEGITSWLEQNLRDPKSGLFWDKVEGLCKVDHTKHTYNQGLMIGNYALRGYLTDNRQDIQSAETLAQNSLDHYTGLLYTQPPEMNSIYLRNLLYLCSQTSDTSLRSRIRTTVTDYSEALWNDPSIHKRPGFFQLKEDRALLIEQAAITEVLALNCWDSSDYPNLL